MDILEVGLLEEDRDRMCPGKPLPSRVCTRTPMQKLQPSKGPKMQAGVNVSTLEWAHGLALMQQEP
eukprot:13258286-Alexandrium_andersonii.AAC.1